MNRYLGIVNYIENISENGDIEKMSENLKERFYISENLNLVKTKHTNLSNGFFCKSFGTKKYCIMFSGNIYNIKDIKKDLINKGYLFSTKTVLKKNKIVPENLLDDYLISEILLSSFNEYKEKFLNYLNGSFSICIYDKTEDYIFLARDRLGIKPLYYTKNNNKFIFSTNIKDILCVPMVKPAIDKQGILELIGLRTRSYSWHYIF